MELLRKNNNGNVVIDAKAIEDIASIVTGRCKDVHPSKSNDFVKFNYKDGNMIIEISCKLTQGCDVAKTCSNLQSRVYEAIDEMADLKIKNININILGFVKEEKK